MTWVQTRDDCGIQTWERPQRKSATCTFRVDHVMASAALPFLFPAVNVDGAWYGDGGIRLTAPLSPAVHLGARRIIAVSTRYARSREEADRPAVTGYPPPAQVAGVLYNAIFLDQLDGDALQLRQINHLIAPLPDAERGGLRHIDLLMLRPSLIWDGWRTPTNPSCRAGSRFLTRGFGTRARNAIEGDMLSAGDISERLMSKRLIQLSARQT
jgi:NTE family protein